MRAGVSATKFRLVEQRGRRNRAAGHHTHYHLKGIVNAIRRSALSSRRDRIARCTCSSGSREAEAAIHDTPIEKVHLHEVGALDSIIDIVGAVYGFEWFGIDDIVSSPLNVGGGTVHCAHGVFPVPAPATARLLAGVPVYGNGQIGARHADRRAAGDRLRARLRAAAGDEHRADRLRRRRSRPEGHAERAAHLHKASERAVDAATPGRRLATSAVVKIECEIDDMNPQLFGPLMDALLAAGALDVFYTPVQMKKSRPGTLVTVIAPPDARQALTDIAVPRVDDDRRALRGDVAHACLDRSVETVEHAVRHGALQDRPPRRPRAERRAGVRRLRTRSPPSTACRSRPSRPRRSRRVDSLAV